MLQHQVIKIPIPPFFDFKECVWFLNRSFDDCMHSIKGNTIFKALMVGQQAVLTKITENEGNIELTLLAGRVDATQESLLKQYIIEWFDMQTDIAPFYKLLKQHGQLAYMCESFMGLRLVGIFDLFEALCWGIIGQQINLTFAYKLKRRLVERYGEALEYEGGVFYIFPSFEVLAKAEAEELRSMQFSQKKAEYIIGIANVFLNKGISKESIAALPGLADKQKALTGIRGIGIWTANYVLMKTLREPGAIPHGDAGLLQALTGHGIIAVRNENDKIEQFFQQVKGWEIYVVFYLWRSLAIKA